MLSRPESMRRAILDIGPRGGFERIWDYRRSFWSAWVLGWVVLSAAGCAGLEPRANTEQRAAAEANAELGMSYLQQGDLTAARRSLERALAFENENPNALLGLAALEEVEGNTAESVQLYRRVLARESANPFALTNLGDLLCRQGETTEALGLLNRGVAASTADTRDVTQLNLALCQIKTGDLQPAETSLRQVLLRDRDNPRALMGLAELSLRKGEPLQTRAFLSRLDSLGVESRRSLELCVEAERALNNPQRARDCEMRRLGRS